MDREGGAWDPRERGIAADARRTGRERIAWNDRAAAGRDFGTRWAGRRVDHDGAREAPCSEGSSSC